MVKEKKKKENKKKFVAGYKKAKKALSKLKKLKL